MAQTGMGVFTGEQITSFVVRMVRHLQLLLLTFNVSNNDIYQCEFLGWNGNRSGGRYARLVYWFRARQREPVRCDCCYRKYYYYFPLQDKTFSLCHAN